jgi:hypothetical protein
MTRSMRGQTAFLALQVVFCVYRWLLGTRHCASSGNAVVNKTDTLQDIMESVVK